MKTVKIAVLSFTLVAAPLTMLSTSPIAHAQSDETYCELQLLRDEIRQMSGRIEELDHELRRLKQRQQEDYRDLDRRLNPDMDDGGDLGAVAAQAPGSRTIGSQAAGPQDGSSASNAIPLTEPRADSPMASDESQTLLDPTLAGGADPRADREQYEAAYDLLRRRRVDDAAQAFQAYVADNPQGRFAANAHYWLGEIYLLQNKLNEAESAFATVRSYFSSDQKAEDAAYKLGRVYHLQGDDRRAKTMLEEVAAGSSNTAQLARDYLRDNF